MQMFIRLLVRGQRSTRIVLLYARDEATCATFMRKSLPQRERWKKEGVTGAKEGDG